MQVLTFLGLIKGFNGKILPKFNQNFLLIDPPTVFGLFRPRQPKLPSSGQLWAVLLEMRYPVVCRVYRIMGLVFEQIRKYFRLLGPFLAFLSIFCRKIIAFKLCKLTSNITHIYQKSCFRKSIRLISYLLYVINLRANTFIKTWFLI